MPESAAGNGNDGGRGVAPAWRHRGPSQSMGAASPGWPELGPAALPPHSDWVRRAVRSHLPLSSQVQLPCCPESVGHRKPVSQGSGTEHLGLGGSEFVVSQDAFLMQVG